MVCAWLLRGQTRCAKGRGEWLSLQANALFARGAQKLVLACTEVPVALEAVNAPFRHLTFDPAQALAERCSQLWQITR